MTDEEIGFLDLTTKIRQDLCTKPIILHSNVVVHAHFLVRPSRTVLSITGDGLGSLQSSPWDLSEMTPSILLRGFHLRCTISRCISGFRLTSVSTCSAGGMKPGRYSRIAHSAGLPEYRKECSAVFVMIEWNVLLSENTYSSCFLCRLFEPHSPVRGSFASFFRDAALRFISDLTQYHAIDIFCLVST